MEDKRKSLLRLLEQGDFNSKGPKAYIELEEPPEVVKDIITRIKKKKD